MHTATYLRTRVTSVPLAAGLLVGDAGAITTFAAIGVSTHGGDPIGDPGRVLLVAAPFVVGWVLPAALAGLYTRDALASPFRTVGRTLPAWIAAVLIGGALRSTALFPGGTAGTFLLVVFAFGGLLLLGWRLVAALVT